MTDILLLQGRVIGGYIIQSQIGEGGMATVYSARASEAENGGDTAAVKIISPQLTTKPEFVTRFEREARLMASLQHPYILPVYAYGTDDLGQLYLVMRFVPGGSLSDRAKKKRLTSSEVTQVITQISGALDYAHDLGIVHRDLKPANVLLDTDGTPFLTDFGIAKWKEESVGLTATGTLLGTPGYMAPEQWRSEPVTPRTDIYALGVMSYELLKGELPFQAETPFSMMYKHLDEEPPAISLKLILPKTVDIVIRRAMAKLPERRFPSAGTFASALAEALEGTDSKRETRQAPIVRTGSGDEVTYSLGATPLIDVMVYAADTEQRTYVDAPDDLGKTYVPQSKDEPTYVLDEQVDDYSAIDAGARTLLSRATEAIRMNTGSVSVLAQAVANYVEDLREQAKRKPDLAQGPYKALESYDIADNRLFFGREAAIDALLARSPYGKFTVLHAESGAGKTSLIRAGVMPRLLAGGFLPLYVAVRRRLPHEAIKHALLPDLAVAPDLAGASLRTYLKALAEICGRNREIFIFVDQFETFFTDVFTDEQRAAFISEIAECLDDPLLMVRITLAMRTEYFGLLASFQPRVPQPFVNEFLLRHLTPDEAKRAIILPARRQGYTYQDDVVDVILRDLADKSSEIAPPQLQLVGGAMIESLPAERKTITLQDYAEAGGAAGVLRGYLERLLARLDPVMRRGARVVIESLVRSDQTRDVRTRDSLRGEMEALDLPSNNLDEVLSALRENRVLRVVESGDGQLAYELVHDYLAQQVQIDPETTARKAAQELLERRVGDYERYGSLLTREELRIITAQGDRLRLTDNARALMERSQAVQRRQRRNAILLTTAAILGLIGALALGLFATVRESQNRQDRLYAAQTSEAQIKAQRDTAMITESRLLSGRAIEQLTLDPVVSLNLGIAALTPLDRPYVPEAEFALSRAVQMSRERLFMPSQKRVGGAYWNTKETRVLTFSDDGTARIFDAQTGAELVRLTHGQPVTTARWSPDEARILTGDTAGAVRIFDVGSGKLLLTLEGHRKRVGGAVWSNDGKRILTWSDDSTARVWSAETGKAIATLTGHTGALVLALWNPAQTRILTIGGDQTIRVWDETGKEPLKLSGHKNRIKGAVWNADGTRILSYSDDQKAIVWNAETGETLLTLSGHSKAVTQASWSPDEKRIITTGFDGLAIIWDAQSGKELTRITADSVIDGAVWNKDGTKVVTYGEASAVAVWDTATGQALAALKGHTDTVYRAQWNPNEALILTYSQDGTARIWNAANGSEIIRLSGHNQPVTSAVLSADQSRVLTSGADGSARIWALIEAGVPTGHGEVQRFTPASNKPALSAVWNADESRVVTSSQDGQVWVWDVATGKPLTQLMGHTGAVWQVAFSPDQKRMMSYGEDGTVRIWDAQSWQALGTSKGHQGNIVSAGWSADGKRILTGSEDGTARVWNATDMREVLRIEEPSKAGIWHAVWDAKEARILIATADGKAQVWDAQSGKLLMEITVSDQPVIGATWSHDESHILVWGYDNMAHIYTVATGQEKARFRGHGDWVVQAMWNRDETQVITTSSDGTMRLWDAATGTTIRVFEGHADSVIGALWNADQTRVLTRSVDGTARVWDIATGVEVLRLDGHTARIRSIAWNKDQTLILTASDDGTIRTWRSWPTLKSLVDFADRSKTRVLNDEQRAQFFLPPTTPTPTPTASGPTS